MCLKSTPLNFGIIKNILVYFLNYPIQYLNIRLLFLISFLLLPNLLFAQKEKVPNLKAAIRTGDIAIDGRLDEAAWLVAVPTRNFIQREPLEGAKPEKLTEVRVLYDNRALYVAARMYDDNPKTIAKQLVRRDEGGQFDYFTISIDPNNDKRTGYQFRVSAAGVQRDAYLYDDVRRDNAWNAVWASSARIDEKGWVAEIRIPLSQIRYDVSESPQSWGINFTRRCLANNETVDFALQSRVQYGRVSVLGRLDGLTLNTKNRRLEFRPFILGNARTAPSEDDNPFFDGSEFNKRFGIDIRYGLGSSYTLDMAFKPDFGQVEVDPAVINLSEFETFYQERRPFFVEDAKIFDFNLSGRDELIYSRRIGRQPTGRAPGGSTYSDIPQETTIIGAAKITGRSLSGTSVGVLAAITGHEKGKSYSKEENLITNFTVEPRAEHGVFRIRHDFRDGATQLGAVGTLLHRNLPNDGSFNHLTSNAFAAGLDFEHNWGGVRKRDWAVYGYIAGSHVRGSSESILRIQRSSNHYFQRPDATGFAVDSTATSINGANWRLQLARRDTRNWSGSIWLAEISPGFEINDLGFSRSTERIDGGARIEYRNFIPGRLFRNYRINLSTFYNFSHEALDNPWSVSSWQQNYKRGAFMGYADFELKNFWDIEISSRYSPTRFSDTMTRGGPVMKSPRSFSIYSGIETDRRKAITLGYGFEAQWIQNNGYEWSTGFDTTIRPTTNFELEISPRFTWEKNPAQYVTQTDELLFEPTYGTRYIFSDLQSRFLSLETRLNVAFSPNFTFQLYAQPLLASGDYLNYKQLLKPNSFTFDILDEGTRSFVDPKDSQRHLDFNGDGMTDINFSDRDFNIQSLRMNLVLRWEYKPGSRVFFVWQQNRDERDATGSVKIGEGLKKLLTANSSNRFIIKFNYWFGL